MKRLVAAFVVLLCAGTAQSQTPARPQVPAEPPPPIGGPVITIKQGQVQGYVTNGVSGFRGLPYAAAPVGDLRWREPRPPAPWTGVRAANAFGAACNQQED